MTKIRAQELREELLRCLESLPPISDETLPFMIASLEITLDLYIEQGTDKAKKATQLAKKLIKTFHNTNGEKEFK